MFSINLNCPTDFLKIYALCCGFESEILRSRMDICWFATFFSQRRNTKPPGFIFRYDEVNSIWKVRANYGHSLQVWSLGGLVACRKKGFNSPNGARDIFLLECMCDMLVARFTLF